MLYLFNNIACRVQNQKWNEIRSLLFDVLELFLSCNICILQLKKNQKFLLFPLLFSECFHLYLRKPTVTRSPYITYETTRAYERGVNIVAENEDRIAFWLVFWVQFWLEEWKTVQFWLLKIHTISLKRTVQNVVILVSRIIRVVT